MFIDSEIISTLGVAWWFGHSIMPQKFSTVCFTEDLVNPYFTFGEIGHISRYCRGVVVVSTEYGAHVQSDFYKYFSISYTMSLKLVVNYHWSPYRICKEWPINQPVL